MKKVQVLFSLLTFSFILLISLTCPLSAADKTEMDKLLSERQIDCWVEGEAFGDLILGARGSIQFIYLDAKLSKAIAEKSDLASWVDDLNQYYGSTETRKKILFIANLESNKPWTVEEEKISVGGYHLTKKDVISSSWKNPFGTVDAGTNWQFAFVVPKEFVKPGKEILVGYGDDLTKWRVPK
ncbi:MAG: hypothetical protein GXZ00_01000 [Synergistaceae bacterium]|nr:hypothetical protein [Synergistaceae bacterium]